MSRIAFALAALAVAAPVAASAATDPVFVNAQAGWTGTGVLVQQGQTVTVSAIGRAFTVNPNKASAVYFPPTPGSGRSGESGPEGQIYICVSVPGGTCLVEGAPYGELVGRIGTTTFEIGAASSFVAPASGTLELAVNDYAEFLSDNSGGFTVWVG